MIRQIRMNLSSNMNWKISRKVTNRQLKTLQSFKQMKEFWSTQANNNLPRLKF